MDELLTKNKNKMLN